MPLCFMGQPNSIKVRRRRYIFIPFEDDHLGMRIESEDQRFIVEMHHNRELHVIGKQCHRISEKLPRAYVIEVSFGFVGGYQNFAENIINWCLHGEDYWADVVKL